MQIVLRFSVAVLLVVTNGKTSFTFFVLLRRELNWRTELQSGFYGRAQWDSLCYRVFVQSLVCTYKNFP